MNYRHSFHAGNFADVVKHAALARIICYLLQKQTSFRYIDTHAGVGAYDLYGGDATRTGEWEKGIERIFKHSFSLENTAFLEPYLASVARLNTDDTLKFYPGSPEIAAQLMRPDDRLSLCELHEEDFKHLKWRYSFDKRVKASHLDGWTGLNAFVPPKERRGLVLIDPPYEKPGEFDRIYNGLTGAMKKWATGIYMLWYPIKHKHDTDAFIRRMHDQGIARMLQAELFIRAPNSTSTLNGTGLLIINPPWLLASELQTLFAELAPLLHQEKGSGWEVSSQGTEPIIT